MTDRPADVRRFLLGLCVVLAVAAPLCLFFGERGFAPVVGVAGLLCIPWARPTLEDRSGVRILAALALWAAVSLAWSPAPNLHLPHSLKALSRFTVLHLALQLALSSAFVTALARLDKAASNKALAWIASGFLVAPTLLIEEGLTGAKLFQALPALIHQPVRDQWLPADLAQGGYVTAVMVWPLGVALWRRKLWPLALALAAFPPVSMVVLRGVAPTAGLVISAPVFLLVLWAGRPAARALAAVTAAAMMTAPLVLLTVDRAGAYARLGGKLAPSWSDRLRIWGFVAEQWARHPFRGAGLDASRTFPDQVPLHPHNGTLQLWFELGLPGAVLGTLFWLWLWRRIADCAERDRLHGAVAAATATVYLTICTVSFGLWQEWWLCVGAFAMALCVLLGRTLAPTAA
ncbi:MAG: O-antigen ligase family protein [Caulobacteraceae bacterium]